MASTYTGNLQGAGAAQQSMLGFGPAAGSPYFSGADQQRLQYYSSQPQHQAPAAPVSSDISGRRSGKVKFFDTQKVGSTSSREWTSLTYLYIHRALASSMITGQKILVMKRVRLKYFWCAQPIADGCSSRLVFVHYTSITAKSGFRSLAEGEEVRVPLPAFNAEC